MICELPGCLFVVCVLSAGVFALYTAAVAVTGWWS